jgi:myo-inositol-1(or 4)-monophosphatase
MASKHTHVDLELLDRCSIVNSLLQRVSALVFAHIEKIQALRYKIRIKDDGSPVTDADVYIENLLHDFLRIELPGLRFIGEESFDFAWDGKHTYLAVLDPIDGTENFCSGLKEWGVSLGIWYEQTHLGSMLLLPELGERLITGDKLSLLTSRITGFSSSFTPAIATGIEAASEYRVTGCAVYNLFNVARGAFARFINPKGAYVWDLLPGIMLALENGCEVLLDDKPYDGELLDPTRKYRVDIRHRYDLHPR